MLLHQQQSNSIHQSSHHIMFSHSMKDQHHAHELSAWGYLGWGLLMIFIFQIVFVLRLVFLDALAKFSLKLLYVTSSSKKTTYEFSVHRCSVQDLLRATFSTFTTLCLVSSTFEFSYATNIIIFAVPLSLFAVSYSKKTEDLFESLTVLSVGIEALILTVNAWNALRGFDFDNASISSEDILQAVLLRIVGLSSTPIVVSSFSCLDCISVLYLRFWFSNHVTMVLCFISSSGGKFKVKQIISEEKTVSMKTRELQFGTEHIGLIVDCWLNAWCCGFVIFGKFSVPLGHWLLAIILVLRLFETVTLRQFARLAVKTVWNLLSCNSIMHCCLLYSVVRWLFFPSSGLSPQLFSIREIAQIANIFFFAYVNMFPCSMFHFEDDDDEDSSMSFYEKKVHQTSGASTRNKNNDKRTETGSSCEADVFVPKFTSSSPSFERATDDGIAVTIFTEEPEKVLPNSTTTAPLSFSEHECCNFDLDPFYLHVFANQIACGNIVFVPWPTESTWDKLASETMLLQQQIIDKVNDGSAATKIFVGSLPSGVTQKEMMWMFWCFSLIPIPGTDETSSSAHTSSCGPPVFGIVTARSGKNRAMNRQTAYVRFQAQEDAERAVATFNRRVLVVGNGFYWSTTIQGDDIILACLLAIRNDDFHSNQERLVEPLVASIFKSNSQHTNSSEPEDIFFSQTATSNASRNLSNASSQERIFASSQDTSSSSSTVNHELLQEQQESTTTITTTAAAAAEASQPKKLYIFSDNSHPLCRVCQRASSHDSSAMQKSLHFIKQTQQKYLCQAQKTDENFIVVHANNCQVKQYTSEDDEEWLEKFLPAFDGQLKEIRSGKYQFICNKHKNTK